MGKIDIMNPWDVESKHVMGVDGISKALYAGECRWGGGEAYVCYGISRSCLKGGSGSNGGMPVGENTMPSIVAQGTGAVCYAIENHPADSRVNIDDSGIVQTLSARMGTGGNNTPMVLIVGNTNSNAAMIDDGTAPTLLGIRGAHGEVPYIVATKEDNNG